jgi:hypothetical protein
MQREQQIRAFLYTDEYSVDKDSNRDIKLGHDYRVVGNNRHASLQNGDFVVIYTKKQRSKKMYAVFGTIDKQLDDEYIQIWNQCGGKSWRYVYSYNPITGIIEIDEPLRQFVYDQCVLNGLKKHVFFNSAYCSKKSKPVFEALMHRIQQQCIDAPNE